MQMRPVNPDIWETSATATQGTIKGALYAFAAAAQHVVSFEGAQCLAAVAWATWHVVSGAKCS